MALYSIDFENGQAGQTPATASTLPGPSSAFSAGTTTYDTTRASHGTMSLRQTPAASDVSYIAYGNSSNLNFNATALAARAYFYFSVAPNGNAYLSIYDNANLWVAGMGINGSGHLFIRDATSSSLIVGTPTLDVANQWARLEIYTTAATSGATLTAAVYLGNNTTPLDTITTTTASTAATLSSLRVGKNNYSAYATPYWVDSLAINTTATGLIGPIAPNTPFRIWNGTSYIGAEVRIWNGTGYESL